MTLELGSNQRIPSWFEIFKDDQRRKKRNARGRKVEDVDLSSLSVLTLQPEEELHIFNPRFRVFDVHFVSLSYQLETKDNSSSFNSHISIRNFAGDANPLVEFLFEVNNTVSTNRCYVNLVQNKRD